MQPLPAASRGFLCVIRHVVVFLNSADASPSLKLAAPLVDRTHRNVMVTQTFDDLWPLYVYSSAAQRPMTGAAPSIGRAWRWASVRSSSVRFFLGQQGHKSSTIFCQWWTPAGFFFYKSLVRSVPTSLRHRSTTGQRRAEFEVKLALRVQSQRKRGTCRVK